MDCIVEPLSTVQWSPCIPCVCRTVQAPYHQNIRGCFRLHSLSSPNSLNQTAMPASVKTGACTGYVSCANGCFYARAIYDGEWPCVQCGVAGVETLASKTFNQWCIRCFYSSDEVSKCQHDGCKRSRQIVKKKQEAMPPPGMTSSLESDAGPSNAASSANDTQQQIEAVKEDVHSVKTRLTQTHKLIDDELIELSDQVRELQEKVKVMAECLERWNTSWYAKWGTSATDPSSGAMSWSSTASSGPSAAEYNRS